MGEGVDGSCNTWGCAAAVGAGPGGDNGRLYGPSAQGAAVSAIDSRFPFTLAASFGDHGELRVTATQGVASLVVWDSARAGNGGGAVPPEATEATRVALERGMVLVVSLWGAEEPRGMAWLDGGCDPPRNATAEAAGAPRDAFPFCDLSQAELVLSDLSIDAPSPSPPAPPPPPPPCAEWCNVWTCDETPDDCNGCSMCGGPVPHDE